VDKVQSAAEDCRVKQVECRGCLKRSPCVFFRLCYAIALIKELLRTFLMHSLFRWSSGSAALLALGITASACTQIVTCSSSSSGYCSRSRSPARTPASGYPDVGRDYWHVHLFKPWHKETYYWLLMEHLDRMNQWTALNLPQ